VRIDDTFSKIKATINSNKKTILMNALNSLGRHHTYPPSFQ
jgi:hypothetical protein